MHRLDHAQVGETGVRDFAPYDTEPGAPLIADFFTEAAPGMKALA